MTLANRLIFGSKLTRRGCWVWQRGRSGTGYGALWHRGRFHYAHRLAAVVFLKARLRPGRLALHRCDEPACVNPRHLYVGNASDNLRDAYRRGRR